MNAGKNLGKVDMTSHDPKVIMIVGDYPPTISGVGDPVALLARELIATGIKVTVITTRIQNLPAYQLSEGIGIFRVVRGWEFSDVSKMLMLIDRMGPKTIVHIHYHCPVSYGRKPMVNLLPVIIRILRPRCRIVVTHHEFKGVSLLWKCRVMPMLLFPHAIIVTNLGSYNLLCPWLAFLGVRMVLIQPTSNIPIAADDREDQANMKRTIGINAGEVIIGFFGGLRPDKGFEYLLGAVREIRLKGFAVRLLVIGGFEYSLEASSPYARVIRGELKLGESEKWVILASAKAPESVSRLLKVVDLAVFPFTKGARENNGSLLAALANRVPTITTRGSDTPMGFEQEFGVDTVPANNYRALVQRITKFVESPDVRAGISSKLENARKGIISWNQIATKVLAFYSTLYGGK